MDRLDRMIDDDLAAIQRGIRDMEKGSYRPFADFDSEFRERNQIPSFPSSAWERTNGSSASSRSAPETLRQREK